MEISRIVGKWSLQHATLSLIHRPPCLSSNILCDLKQKLLVTETENNAFPAAVSYTVLRPAQPSLENTKGPIQKTSAISCNKQRTNPARKLEYINSAHMP